MSTTTQLIVQSAISILTIVCSGVVSAMVTHKLNAQKASQISSSAFTQKEYSVEENNMSKHLADERGPMLHGSHMIRQAVPDDAIIAVPLILQAIGHIAFVLSGTNDDQETTSILTNFFCREDNRISYQNTLVMEEDGVVVGMTILYDGCKNQTIGCTDRARRC